MRKGPRGQLLEAGPPFLQGSASNDPRAEREQVEDEQQGGVLAREQRDPTRRRMNPLQEVVEREARALRNDDLAVENDPRGRKRRDRLDDLGEVTAERLARLRAEVHRSASRKTMHRKPSHLGS